MYTTKYIGLYDLLVNQVGGESIAHGELPFCTDLWSSCTLASTSDLISGILFYTFFYDWKSLRL